MSDNVHGKRLRAVKSRKGGGGGVKEKEARRRKEIGSEGWLIKINVKIPPEHSVYAVHKRTKIVMKTIATRHMCTLGAMHVMNIGREWHSSDFCLLFSRLLTEKPY